MMFLTIHTLIVLSTCFSTMPWNFMMGTKLRTTFNAFEDGSGCIVMDLSTLTRAGKTPAEIWFSTEMCAEGESIIAIQISKILIE